MSKLLFRATSPQDAGAVSAFLQRIFEMGSEHPVVEPRHLHWKCWEERADWPGSRGYVLTSPEGIVAHGTVVPLSLLSGELQFKMVHPIDWAAESTSVGGGVGLLKRMGRSVDAILVVGGSDMTQKILPALGFKLRGHVQRFARPLRPLRRLAGQEFGWRLCAQFARSVVWAWQAPSERAHGWEARRVALDDLAASAIPWPKAGRGTLLFERTPDVIGYYLRCPATPMELYEVAKEKSVRGYFMLAFAPAQARIVDLWIDSADRRDWRALVQLAVRQAARNRSVAEVVSVASDPVGSQAFLDCGFHARGSSPLRLLACNKREIPDMPIGIRMLDSDAAYLHNNTNQFWA
jgi:hypothetical protein